MSVLPESHLFADYVTLQVSDVSTHWHADAILDDGDHRVVWINFN